MSKTQSFFTLRFLTPAVREDGVFDDLVLGEESFFLEDALPPDFGLRPVLDFLASEARFFELPFPLLSPVFRSGDEAFFCTLRRAFDFGSALTKTKSTLRSSKLIFDTSTVTRSPKL